MIILITFQDDLGLSELLCVVVQECQHRSSHVAFLDRYIIEQNADLENLIFQINKVYPQLRLQLAILRLKHKHIYCPPCLVKVFYLSERQGAEDFSLPIFVSDNIVIFGGFMNPETVCSCSESFATVTGLGSY